MKLENKTSFPAEMLIGSTGDYEQTAVVACKVTYQLRDGALRPVADKQWPIINSPSEFRGVMIGSEVDFRKEGIDVLVFGTACAPGEQPVPRSRVEVECGPTAYKVDIVGDRHWLKAGRSSKASDPIPFATMPLTSDRAFGGKAMNNGNECQHAINPDGKGLCFAAADAVNKPLPNLERPDTPMQNWNDTPVPACFYKPVGLLPDNADMFKNLAASPDKMALPRAVAFRSFNAAVPGMVIPSGQAGKTLRVAGMDPWGEVVYPLPPCTAIVGKSGPVVHAAIGDIRSRFPLSISTLMAIIPERLLIVTYVGLFRYLFRPNELRSAVLKWYGAADVPAIANVTGDPRTRGKGPVLAAPPKPSVELPAPLTARPLPPPPAPPPASNVAVVQGVIDEKRILTALWKRTYTFTPAQAPVPASQQLPISLKNVLPAPATPGGPQGSPTEVVEAVSYKSGTDVVIRAFARPPEPIAMMNVGVTVGNLRHAAAVTGKRRIDVVNGRMIFTPPERFAEMALRYENAYGGSDPWFDEHAHDDFEKQSDPEDWRKVGPILKEYYKKGVPPYVYARNRFGKGYVLARDPAVSVGRELPNIELPNDRLTPERIMIRHPRQWVRMPLPAGFDFLDPVTFPRTAMMGLPPFPQNELSNVTEVSNGQVPRDYCRGNVFDTPREKIPNLIHPDVGRNASIGLRCGFLCGDETIALDGMDAKIPQMQVRLPGEVPTLSFALRGKTKSLPTTIFQVFIDVDKRLLTVIHAASMPLDITLDYGELAKIQSTVTAQFSPAGSATQNANRSGLLSWLGLKG